MAVTGSNVKGFTLKDGLIRYKGRIWLGQYTDAHQEILTAMHDTSLGGHSGVTATYNKIKALFAWPRMKQDIALYISKCEVCQRAKSEHSKLPGLLQPLLVPTQAWHTVSLDFIEGLPKSKSFDTILVVIDKFTKYGHFIPLAHPYSALSIAQLYLDNVYKLHGLPQVIIYDRDRIFTSAFWKELFNLIETTLNMSSSYHPQTDGQTERLNQCLETYLRCMVHSCPNKWSSWIVLAEFWYNTTPHSAHGKTPFQVLYGHPPRHFGIGLTSMCTVPDLEQWLREHEDMTQVIKHNLLRAQQRMKHQADKHRQERQFSVGDWIYLKLQPYVQHSVAKRSCQKLGYKFFGPYLITQKVGAVAYRLQLPTSSQIHPVIHVSQLKKALPPEKAVSADEELHFVSISVSSSPEQVLASRLQRVGNNLLPFDLIKWKGLPKAWTTWENLNALQLEFLGMSLLSHHTRHG